MKTNLRNYLATVAVAALLAGVLAGCNGETVTADTSVDDPLAPPAFTEIAAAVSLDALQGETIKAALAEWREASASQVGRRQRGAEGMRGPGQGHNALMMEFVADVAPDLDTAQLASLVSFISDHQESRMEKMWQKREGRRGMGRHGGGHLSALDLTGEQQAAMKEAREATRNAMRALHDQLRDGAITEDELRAQKQAVRDAMHETIAGILTEEQLAKLEEIRAERRTARLEQRLENLGSRIDQRLDFITRVLDLTEEQQLAIRGIMETSIEEKKAILESILAGDVTHDDGRTALHELRTKTRDAVKAELTDEQLERLEAVRALRMMRGRRHG